MSTPIVLVHAFPENAQMWNPVVQRLTQADREVVTFDLPGYGEKAQAELPAEPDLAFFVAELLSVLDQVDAESFILGGLSLGGYVTLAALPTVAPRLAGVILADTKASADPQPAVEVRLQFAQRAETEGVDWIPEAMLPTVVAAETFTDRPEVIDELTGLMLAAPAASVAWTQRAMAKRPDTHDNLAELDVPVLVIVGEHDQGAPIAAAQAMADTASNSQLVVIDGVGHMSSNEDPDAFAAAISDWLISNSL